MLVCTEYGGIKNFGFTIKYGKLVCNYQVRVLKQTIKNGVDFIGKKWCYLSNIVENYHETRVNYQTKWESNIGIQTWWGKFPVEVLTGKHRREWSMFDLWCVWLQEVLVRIQWDVGVPPSSILQGFSQQNMRLSTSFNRQTLKKNIIK